MDLDDELSRAFAEWSSAREMLGQLRQESAPIGQLANSPEVAARFQRVAAQERVCEDLFAALLGIAEKRADLREKQRVAELGERAGRK